jgi:hypothetical protein
LDEATLGLVIDLARKMGATVSPANIRESGWPI